MKRLVCLLAVLLVTSFVSASIIEVGTGANTVVERRVSPGVYCQF
jgi:hypothetical protein